MALRRLHHLFRNLLRKEQVAQDLDEELRSYLELQAEEKVRSGMDREAALQQARRELGGVERLKESVRDASIGVSMDNLLQDLRYGLRSLRKNPGVSAVAILTLALGIGANTTIFSIVDSLLFRPLPVRDSGRIAELSFRQKDGPVQSAFSIADFRDIRKQSSSVFSDVIGAQIELDGLSVNGRADRILTYYVSGNYFSMLGLKPAVGRLMNPSEGEVMGADPIIVLDYGYWKKRFGADPGIVGKSVTVDGHAMTIAGVAPEGFHGTFALFNVQAYLPLGMLSIEGNAQDAMTDRAVRNLSVFGRLQPGRNLAQVNAVLAVSARRLSEQYRETDRDMAIEAVPEAYARVDISDVSSRLALFGLFLGLALMVLLLACVNVGNLLLVRATAREHEMAIRSALGAGRTRLIRQLLTESVLLAFAGGIAGILLGMWGSAALGQLDLHVDVPIRLDFGVDWRVFSYAFGAALLTGLVVGIVPAAQASRGNLNSTLREGGRGLVGKRTRLRSALVVVEVGGSMVLLIIAGLFTRSLTVAQRTNLGFNPAHVLDLTMDPVEIGYTEAQGQLFYRTLLERVRALPGVTSASVANSVPMGYYGNSDLLNVEGYQQPSGSAAPPVGWNVVSTDYFKTLEIPLLKGRTFTVADNEKSADVAIVNETMAKRYWPTQDPVGRHFRIAIDPKRTLQVVGVTRDSRVQHPTGRIRPYFYVPLAQQYTNNSLATLQIRTSGSPDLLIREAQSTIRALAPNLPVFDVRTMSQSLNTLNGFLMFQVGAGLAAALGALGLILAVVGVYGVVSYSASQLRHEIGIRMALGARPSDILRMVFRQGLVITCAGLMVGLLSSVGAARMVGTFLAVSAADPLTWIGVSFLLGGIALIASIIPARRATRVDAMVAVRCE